MKDNVEAWLFWTAANVSVSWFLALIVDIIPSIIRFVIVLVWGHVSEAVKNKLELYASVKDTVKPLFYAAGSWVSWVIIFVNIFHLYDQDDESASRASYTPRVSSSHDVTILHHSTAFVSQVYQVIQFLFFFALVICAQRMLSHAIGVPTSLPCYIYVLNFTP